jgi:CheY-like chemotaxis protein
MSVLVHALFPRGMVPGVPSVTDVSEKVRSWLRREPKVVTPRTILIVDGNAANRKSTASLVEALGYQSLQTAAVAGAIEQLEQQDPDFILLGFDLEDGNGLDALSKIRDVVPELPIVMLADDLWDKRVAEALRRGAVAYLARPFGRASLRELLVKH